MKVIGENGDEQKLLEEKREKMNKLVGLNNISIKENITLLISDWCAEHIRTLHKEYPNTEWLAYCKVEPQWKWVFLMTDMLFPWQRGVGWEVETTKEWMERLTKELVRRWERAMDWNCVLHSHHHMGVFWSGTDDNARLSLNDWRQLARAVVTAYDKDEISYKGCINFYKPYNIEIDVNVMNVEKETIWEKYSDYLMKVDESEKKFYDYLLETNKEYIDSITNKPTYSNLLEYLWVDITEELNENYNSLKEKIWNPELIEYLKQLQDKARELALAEVNTWWVYSDMLAEYGAFCNWSDNLLAQLEENRKVKNEYSIWGLGFTPLESKTSYPLNRDFDDYEPYYFTSYSFDEQYIRQTFGIDTKTPMKVWSCWERMAWSNELGEFVYVEEWADEFWG